jgi:hypothetical protein
MEKPQNILDDARKLAKATKTWADLSNALFDPLEGLVARSFPNREERSKFRNTPTYDEFHALVEKKMQETGVANGANPPKSRKFVVRLPHQYRGFEACNGCFSPEPRSLACVSASSEPPRPCHFTSPLALRAENPSKGCFPG